MPDFTPSWEKSAEAIEASESAGNPYDSLDSTAEAERDLYGDEDDEARVIGFLKKLGKSDDEIDKILGIERNGSARPKVPEPRPLFSGDRMGKVEEDKSQDEGFAAMEEDFQNEGNPYAKRESNAGNPGPYK